MWYDTIPPKHTQYINVPDQGWYRFIASSIGPIPAWFRRIMSCWHGRYTPSSIWHQSVDLGAVSIRKTVLPGMAIPMLKIRRPNGRLIFNMEIAIRR